MGKVSEMNIDIDQNLIARVQMPLNVFKRLKDLENFEEMMLLSVYNPSYDYTVSKQWKEAKNALKQAYLKKEEIEAQIRVEKALEK